MIEYISIVKKKDCKVKVKLQNIIETSFEDQMKIRDWRNDPRTADVFLISHIEEETHKNWLESQRKEKPSTQAFFIIVDDIKVGIQYLSHIDYDNHTAEPGFFMNPDFGEEYGIVHPVAGYIMMRYAIEKLGIFKFNIKVLDNNPSMVRQNKRAGYVEEGLLKNQILKNGKRYDVHLMGMFASDWLERNKYTYEYYKDYIEELL